MKKILLLITTFAHLGMVFAADTVNTDLLKKSLNPTAKIERVLPSVIPGLLKCKLMSKLSI